MLLKDKYTPKKFDESLVNLEIIKKLKNIKHPENFIFNGINGTGKYILAQMLLEHLYGKNIYKKKTQTISYNTKSFDIYSSNFHYEIVLYQNNFDKKELNNLFSSISNSLNIINNSSNIILIKNSEYLFKENLYLIKKLCEKKNIIFMMLTNNLNYITRVINSFINIRVPVINSKELLTLVKYIKKTEKIKIFVRDIKEIIDNNNNNLSKILLNLEIYKKTKQIKMENKIDNLLDKTLDLVYEKKVENILKIRKQLYDICSQNVDRYYILHYGFKKTVKKLEKIQKKIELLNFLNEINSKISQSFKNIIHIEYFFIKLMDIIE